jgi:hypothetical protein
VLNFEVDKDAAATYSMHITFATTGKLRHRKSNAGVRTKEDANEWPMLGKTAIGWRRASLTVDRDARTSIERLQREAVRQSGERVDNMIGYS